jgi:hypothetical protein
MTKLVKERFVEAWPSVWEAAKISKKQARASATQMRNVKKVAEQATQREAKRDQRTANAEADATRKASLAEAAATLVALRTGRDVKLREFRKRVRDSGDDWIAIRHWKAGISIDLLEKIWVTSTQPLTTIVKIVRHWFTRHSASKLSVRLDTR